MMFFRMEVQYHPLRFTHRMILQLHSSEHHTVFPDTTSKDLRYSHIVGGFMNRYCLGSPNQLDIATTKIYWLLAIEFFKILSSNCSSHLWKKKKLSWWSKISSTYCGNKLRHTFKHTSLICLSEMNFSL